MKISRLIAVSAMTGATVALAAGAAVPASAGTTVGTIYGMDWSSGALFTIDPTTAVMTAIMTTSPAIGGSAGMFIDQESLNIIVPTYANSPYPVYEIDPSASTQSEVSATGQAVTAAAVTATANLVAYDIADPNNPGESASKLASMDASSGVLTPIADVMLNSVNVRVSAMAFCSGTLYAFTYSNSDAVFSVDATTGILTQENSGGSGAGSIMGADCNNDGVLYAVNGSELYTASRGDGDLSLVAALSGDAGGLETLAISSTPGVVPPGPSPELPVTGFNLASAIIAGLAAAGVTALGTMLVARRRARA